MLQQQALDVFGQVVDLAGHDARDVVDGLADAVVRHPVLLEVVRPHLRPALPAAHLRLPQVRPPLVQPLLLTLEDPRPQDPHRPVAVLVLAPLVLALHLDLVRRPLSVPDADGALGLVDVLTAGPDVTALRDAAHRGNDAVRGLDA